MAMGVPGYIPAVGQYRTSDAQPEKYLNRPFSCLQVRGETPKPGPVWTARSGYPGLDIPVCIDQSAQPSLHSPGWTGAGWIAPLPHVQHSTDAPSRRCNADGVTQTV